MLGGAAFLADSVLTPAVSISSAVEGLKTLPALEHLFTENKDLTMMITAVIIVILFAVQSRGTESIGKVFGSVVMVWFAFLAIVGVVAIGNDWSVLAALNPYYGIKFLFSPNNATGLALMGTVFLSTTGAEALYSDMGHVGRGNIYATWPFVKCCLLLSYMGQGAWLMNNAANPELMGIADLNPFYQMLAPGLRPFAVGLSTVAAIIASQALITGAFSLVSEASRLDLMPHMQVFYPAETKGQLYIDKVNKILWVGCSLVVLYFRSGARMESAYGLAITITMLMTTLLISVYLRKNRGAGLLSWVVLVVFGLIESVFFVSSLGKFAHGGYVTVILTLLLLGIMLIWHRGTRLERMYCTQLDLRDFIPSLEKLHSDETVPLLSHNLVYLDGSTGDEIDRDILYSILDKGPKRAQAYWFVSVDVLNEPDTLNYRVETSGTDFIFRIRLELGFRRSPRINLYLRSIVQNLQRSGELPAQDKKYSIYGPSTVGTFQFCMIHKAVSTKTELSALDEAVLNMKYSIRGLAGSKVQWYGLDTSSVITENVPLIVSARSDGERIERKM